MEGSRVWVLCTRQTGGPNHPDRRCSATDTGGQGRAIADNTWTELSSVSEAGTAFGPSLDLTLKGVPDGTCDSAAHGGASVAKRRRRESGRCPAESMPPVGRKLEILVRRAWLERVKKVFREPLAFRERPCPPTKSPRFLTESLYAIALGVRAISNHRLRRRHFDSTTKKVTEKAAALFPKCRFVRRVPSVVKSSLLCRHHGTRQIDLESGRPPVEKAEHRGPVVQHPHHAARVSGAGTQTMQELPGRCHPLRPLRHARPGAVSPGHRLPGRRRVHAPAPLRERPGDTLSSFATIRAGSPAATTALPKSCTATWSCPGALRLARQRTRAGQHRRDRLSLVAPSPLALPGALGRALEPSSAKVPRLRSPSRATTHGTGSPTLPGRSAQENRARHPKDGGAGAHLGVSKAKALPAAAAAGDDGVDLGGAGAGFERY